MGQIIEREDMGGEGGHDYYDLSKDSLQAGGDLLTPAMWALHGFHTFSNSNLDM